MADALAHDRHRGVPRLLALIERSPLAPAWIGLAIALGFFAAFVLSWRVIARWDASRSEPAVLWFEALGALLIGYAPAAAAYSVRGSRHIYESLRGALDCSDAEFRAELANVDRFDLRWLHAVGLVSAAAGMAISVWGPGWPDGVPPLGDPTLSWVLFRNGLSFWIFGQLGYMDVVSLGRFAAAGGRWARVDLLDPEPLTPFARRGLRSVLMWMGAAVMVALQAAVAPWDPASGYAVAVLLAALAALALLLPVWGVHRRLLRARTGELARVRNAIRRERDANLAGDAAPDARLANLVAYEQRIASAGTFPFDVPTLLRFALYLSLGLGSWLGGALVERLVDGILG